MNPSVLLSLIHDLQQKIIALCETSLSYENRIKELEEALEQAKRPTTNQPPEI